MSSSRISCGKKVASGFLANRFAAHPCPVTVHGAFGDSLVFRPKRHRSAANLVRKHGTVPFAFDWSYGAVPVNHSASTKECSTAHARSLHPTFSTKSAVGTIRHRRRLRTCSPIQHRSNTERTGRALAQLEDDGKSCRCAGLVPSWAKNPSIGNRMIKCAGRNRFDEPIFSHCAETSPVPRTHRWLFRMEEDRKGKTTLPHSPAGRTALRDGRIREHWEDAVGTLLETFSVITTEANVDATREIHHRMPANSLPSDYGAVALIRTSSDCRPPVATAAAL